MKNIEDLIIENERLIYNIINKYKNHFELDDLYQVAVIGILKAYKKYNKNYNTKFTTYAYPYILGEVIKYINEFRNIKINKNSKLLYSKIMKAKETLSQKMMKEPTNYEIALFLELDESLIDEVINANTKIDSLDKIIYEENNNFELYEKIGFNDKTIDNYSLIYELEKLSKEEKQIIKARYYEDLSQKEIANILGTYQVEVSRKEQKILKKLKNNIITWQKITYI